MSLERLRELTKTLRDPRNDHHELLSIIKESVVIALETALQEVRVSNEKLRAALLELDYTRTKLEDADKEISLLKDQVVEVLRVEIPDK